MYSRLTSAPFGHYKCQFCYDKKAWKTNWKPRLGYDPKLIEVYCPSCNKFQYRISRTPTV